MNYPGLNYFISRNGKDIPFEDMPEEYRDKLNDTISAIQNLLKKMPCIDHREATAMIWVIDTDGKTTINVSCCCWARWILVTALGRAESLPWTVTFPASTEPTPANQLQRQGELGTHFYRFLTGEDASDPTEPNPHNIWPHPN